MSNDRRLIVNCSGGLGNQMFEYAAGKFFARRFNRVLEVVKPSESKQQAHGFKRPFQLDAFRISLTPREASLFDRVFFSGNPLVQRWHGVLGRLFDAQANQELSAYWYRPEIDIYPNRKNAYLKGYWQSAAYVKAVEAELREEFQLCASLKERNRADADRINELKCPISVHVRIGDYALIDHPAGERGEERVSNVLPAHYYERALAQARELFGNHTLVVFSDEPERARKLFEDSERCLFVEGNDELYAHEDMWLMSLCRHHVIANSSFSWWGAWLGHNPDKRVFAPRHWGNTPDSHFPDLCPKEWIIVDNL